MAQVDKSCAKHRLKVDVAAGDGEMSEGCCSCCDNISNLIPIQNCSNFDSKMTEVAIGRDLYEIGVVRLRME